MKIGHKLASDGFSPRGLVRQAQLAEKSKFDFEDTDQYE
jgi:hypothetical protein